MDVCLRRLKESDKSRFGIVACTVFATTFLEIAVYSTEAPNATTEWFHLSQECLMGILVLSNVFGGFSSHPKLLATMMGRLVENRGHGVAVLYTEILRRPSLIMMVIYLGKKKMLKTPNTLYELDWQLSRNFKPFSSSRNFLAIFLLRAVILQKKKSLGPPDSSLRGSSLWEVVREWDKKVSRDSRTRNGVELARYRFEFSWTLKLFICMHHLVTLGNLLW